MWEIFVWFGVSLRLVVILLWKFGYEVILVRLVVFVFKFIVVLFCEGRCFVSISFGMGRVFVNIVLDVFRVKVFCLKGNVVVCWVNCYSCVCCRVIILGLFIFGILFVCIVIGFDEFSNCCILFKWRFWLKCSGVDVVVMCFILLINWGFILVVVLLVFVVLFGLLNLGRLEIGCRCEV